MSEIMPPARHTLTAEQSRVPFAPDVLALLTGPDRYHVTSAALMDFMDEMEHSGFVYNADAICAWSRHCGLPEPENAHLEGTPLSALVYNGQKWRRSRALERAGFVRGTQDMLDQCGRTGERLEFPGGTVHKVRLVNGAFYAMLPRSRTRAAVVVGSPCKIIPAL